MRSVGLFATGRYPAVAPTRSKDQLNYAEQLRRLFEDVNNQELWLGSAPMLPARVVVFMTVLIPKKQHAADYCAAVDNAVG